MKRSPDRDIENVSPTTRKSLKKKAGMMQVDKEAREGVKNLEINYLHYQLISQNYNLKNNQYKIIFFYFKFYINFN